jgi:hypothetical protein
MSNFLLYSIIGSVFVTILVNALLLIFPKVAQRAQQKLLQKTNETTSNATPDGKLRVLMFFPWKVMLILSIVLTIVVNVVAYFAGR